MRALSENVYYWQSEIHVSQSSLISCYS